MPTQCKNSWNSCQDLAYSYIFPFTLESLDKILFILASHEPLEILDILDSILGNSLIKSVNRMNKVVKQTHQFCLQVFCCCSHNQLAVLPDSVATLSFFEVLNIGQHKVLKRGSLVGSAKSCGIIGTLIELLLASVFVCFIHFCQFFS